MQNPSLSPVAPLSTHPPLAFWSKQVMWVVTMLAFCLAAAPLAQAQTTPVIWSFSLDSGEYFYPQGAVTKLGNGHALTQYLGSSGSTASVEWEGDQFTGDVVDWKINPVGGGPLDYTDGTSMGCPGGFHNQSSGYYNLNYVNEFPYTSYNGDANTVLPQLYPTTDAISDQANITSLTYNNVNYRAVADGWDLQGRSLVQCSDGNNTCLVRYYPYDILQLAFSDGTVAKYLLSPHARGYLWQPSSTAANLLSNVNGFPVVVKGSKASFLLPIRNYVYTGIQCSLDNIDSIFWTHGAPDASVVTMQVTASTGAAYPASSLSTSDGSLLSFTHSDTLTGGTTTLQQGSAVGSFLVVSSPNAVSFTSFNGIPYGLQGGELVPQAPIQSFTYGKDTYQFASYSMAGDGNYLSTYQSTNHDGSRAAVEISPSTGALVTWTVSPVGGGTATYVDGATVGRPGAYVWSSGSTAGNLLAQINGKAYTASGDMAVSNSAFVDEQGVFKVRGNFMSLGVWSNDPTHVGFSLSYDDGQPVTFPASIELTASRPSTAWLWDAATSDGTGINPMMQLDQSNRLLLYPVFNGSVPDAPAVPAPAIILDPSTSSPSEFNGVVRFEGPVRIAPQGDLSMGEFTQDAFPAQPAQ